MLSVLHVCVFPYLLETVPKAEPLFLQQDLKTPNGSVMRV